MLLKKTLQRVKLKIMLSEAFSYAMWSTIPPMPLKAILDPLKCKIDHFNGIEWQLHCCSRGILLYQSKTQPIFTDKLGTHVIIKIFIKYENSS